jgi:hypothetical protein
MQLYDGGVTLTGPRPYASQITPVEFHACKTLPEHPFGVKAMGAVAFSQPGARGTRANAVYSAPVRRSRLS